MIIRAFKNLNSVFDFFEPFYRKNRKYVILSVIFTFFHKLMAALLPILIKLLVDTIEKGTNFKQFVFYSEVNIVGVLVFLLVLFLRYFFESRTEALVSTDIKRNMIEHILGADYLSLHKEETGYFLERQYADLQNIKNLIIHDPALFLINILYVGAIALIMFRLNAILFLALLTVLPIFLVISRILLPRLKALQSKTLTTEEEINSFTEESVAGAYHIKANNVESVFKRKLSELMSKYLGLNLSYATMDILYDLILFTGIMNVSNLIVYILGGYSVFHGTFTIGGLFAFTIYFSNLWEALEFYTQFPKELKIGTLSINRIEDLLSVPQEQDGQIPLLEPIETIELRNVYFSYGDRQLLRDVNMTIHRNEKIGIVGPNGSGKSTLCNLLTRIVTPTKGSILINGRAYTVFTKESLRSRIILIPQEPYIFRGTLEENLNPLGEKIKDSYGGIEVEAVIKDKEKDKTLKNSSGMFSGGEKKLIQLIRGINRNGDVYILDEPLAFVDKDYRELILQLLKTEFSDKTLIIVSHQAPLEKICDQVYTITTEGSVTKSRNT